MVKKLSEEFNCTNMSVYNAISYKCNSYLAHQIREAACNRYGGRHTFLNEFVD